MLMRGRAVRMGMRVRVRMGVGTSIGGFSGAHLRVRKQVEEHITEQAASCKSKEGTKMSGLKKRVRDEEEEEERKDGDKNGGAHSRPARRRRRLCRLCRPACPGHLTLQLFLQHS